MLKRAQALRLARIEVFQDILSQQPGEEWRARIYDEIDRCDLFPAVLVASGGKISMGRPRDRPRARGPGASAKGVPEIVPVILEGPPPPAAAGQA
ncbi:MAG: hypothetical protein WDN03_15210 [Rhizomicrobium sp.]